MLVAGRTGVGGAETWLVGIVVIEFGFGFRVLLDDDSDRCEVVVFSWCSVTYVLSPRVIADPIFDQRSLLSIYRRDL